MVNRIGIGRLGSSLLGTLCVEILGSVFAQIKKCPVTVFNIPGVAPLTPDISACQAVRAMIEGQLFDTEDLILRMAIVTIATMMGFMPAQLTGEVFFKTRNNRESKKNLV